jgi:hypothetical protein
MSGSGGSAGSGAQSGIFGYGKGGKGVQGVQGGQGQGNVGTGPSGPGPGGQGGAPNWLTSGEYRDPRSPFYRPPVRPLGLADVKEEEEKPAEAAEKDPLYDDAATLAAQRRNLRMRRRPLISQAPADSTLGSSGLVFNRQDYGSTI